MKTSRITTVEELQDALLEAFSLLREDPRRLNQTAELSNTAGKILAASKLKIEYALVRKQIPELNIQFLNNGIEKLLPDASKSDSK